MQLSSIAILLSMSNICWSLSQRQSFETLLTSYLIPDIIDKTKWNDSLVFDEIATTHSIVISSEVFSVMASTNFGFRLKHLIKMWDWSFKSRTGNNYYIKSSMHLTSGLLKTEVIQSSLLPFKDIKWSLQARILKKVTQWSGRSSDHSLSFFSGIAEKT